MRIIHSILWCFIILSFLSLLIPPLNGLSAQEVQSGKTDIYKNAYETALSDGEINDHEEAILNSIKSTLGLSDEEIRAIITTVKTDSGHIDQSGRWLLVAQNMIYGLSVYGWMIPDILGAEDTKWYVGSEMLSLAGTFYCTYLYTKNIPLSLSRAQMMRLGSLLGLRYGFGINTLLDIEREDSQAWELLIMASIPAGIYAGDRLYKKWQPSHGQSWALGLGAYITAFTFHQLHFMINPAPEEPDYDPDSERYRSWENDKKRWDRTSTLIELAGYPVGLYLANRLWSKKSISFGDGLMLTQGTLSGMLYGSMTAVLLGVDFDKGETWRLFPVLGGTIGTYLMDRYIAGYDYTAGQAIVSTLGTISGLAFMSGMLIITETTNDKAIAASVMAGGISGLLLTNKIFDLKKESRTRQSGRDVHLVMLPSLQMERPGGRAVPGISFMATF